MRVLVACDSFKDALPAAEVCAAIAEGLRAGHPGVEVTQLPLGDGGEGTMKALSDALGLRLAQATVADPLMRPVRASWALSGDGRTAVIEMAEASGLQRLTLAERDPEAATTWGTGELVAEAVRSGAGRIILAVGGSATNDGGVGAAAALGWRFLDAGGAPVRPCGGALRSIARIEPPTTRLDVVLEVICDVDNPLTGPSGAALVYGAQKGGDGAAMARLDAGLVHLAQLAADQLGAQGLAQTPGAGAAGGLGFGAVAFLGASLRPAAEVVLDTTGFRQALGGADCVITGEGRLDGQTLHGKLIDRVCRRAAAAGVPVIALCGALEATPAQLAALGLRAAYAINDGAGALAARLARTPADLRQAAARIDLGYSNIRRR